MKVLEEQERVLEQQVQLAGKKQKIEQVELKQLNTATAGEITVDNVGQQGAESTAGVSLSERRAMESLQKEAEKSLKDLHYDIGSKTKGNI